MTLGSHDIDNIMIKIITVLKTNGLGFLAKGQKSYFSHKFCSVQFRFMKTVNFNAGESIFFILIQCLSQTDSVVFDNCMTNANIHAVISLP